MDEKLALIEHLEELRKRVIKSLIFTIAASCLVYSFTDYILPNLITPTGKLIFTAPQEAFVAKLKIALFGGTFFSAPYIFYHIWKFISSAFTQNEKRHALVFGLLSLIFFYLGASFGYFVVIPVGIKFLLGFGSAYIIPMITIESYISFVGWLTLCFGLIFELPLIILFLARIGLVTPRFLSSKRRHAVVIIFIVAAILTPPDVFSQVLMAIPLLILYEISILLSKLVYKK